MSDLMEDFPPVREWAVMAYLCGDNPNLAAHVARQRDAILAFKGSEQFHLAAQWDLPDGAKRAIVTPAEGAKPEPLGRVNTGDPARFLEFLRWAFDRCPAQKVIVVVTGTGLLDARASIGTPEMDRSRLFSVCDDTTSGDALSLSELGPMLRKAIAMAGRERIEILALDLRELQCLEVAYELDGIVEFMVGPQTRVPDSGWNFEVVLGKLDAALAKAGAANPPGAAEVATLLVQVVGEAYDVDPHGHLSLSALDLRTLKNFASAFDTLSLAMMHSVGEELVWEARSAVARKLKPGDPTVAPKATPVSSAPVAARAEPAEAEYLYDLFEMLGELRNELQQAGGTGLLRLVCDHLEPLDSAALKRALESIDAACFQRASRSALPSLADPANAKRALQLALEGLSGAGAAPAADVAHRTEALVALFTDRRLTSPPFHSWLDAWPDEAIAQLEPALRAAYSAAQRQQERLQQLAKMTERVLVLLRGGTPSQGPPVRPLVHAHFTSKSETVSQHGGVSLYRPRNLDRLIASDYLKLRFNRKIHWTVLLAVINLIGSHPRALWRILSALLATSDNHTRAQLIDRITGPDSVVASFRDQFVVLAPAKTYVLSLEPDSSGEDVTAVAGTAAAGTRAQVYRVRLELTERETFISDFRSVVDADALDGAISELVKLLEPGLPLTASEVKRIEALGETLGEDILQELGMRLAEANQSPRQVHLQLQIPRELMKYPWELMHYKDGWLSEHFAMGRQVFSRLGGGIMRSRVPGPLRALVIGNPEAKDEKNLAFAASEARHIAETLTAMAEETDGLLDFRRERDAFIDQKITRGQVRELLRHGNYDIIHFAGHAAFDAKNPAASAWLLSDGRLSARAIRNTLRWRDTQPWLVYASACEAGLDGGDMPVYQSDVFGLASAFLDHGVSAFIGPLWRIDDQVASEIAVAFYQQLLKERQTIGEALRCAKAQAKAKTFDAPSSELAGDGAEPRNKKVSWAGLVLYGNSTATFGQRIGAPAPPEPRNGRSMDESRNE